MKMRQTHDMIERNDDSKFISRPRRSNSWLGSLTVVALLTSLLLPVTAMAQDAKTNDSNAVEDAQRELEAGRELYQSGNFYTAQQAFEKAYNEAPEDSPLKASATFELSGVLWEQGDYVKAYLKVVEAIERAEKAGLTAARGQLYLRKGLIEEARGDLSKASNTLKKCVELADASSDYESSALCRVSQRYLKLALGKKPGSESQYQSDLNLLKATKKPILTGIALSKIGEMQAANGNYASALALYQQAQGQFDKSGSVPAINGNKLKIAQLFQLLERWNDSESLLKELELTFKNMNSRPLLVTTYGLKGRQAEHNGDADSAYKDYKKALNYAVTIASPQLQAQSRLALCEFFARTQDPSRGVLDCQVARGVYNRQGMRTAATRALILESRLQHMAEHYKEAAALYRESLQALAKLPPSQGVTDDTITQASNLCQVATVLHNKSTLDDCQNALNVFDAIQTKTPYQNQMMVQTLVRLGLAEESAKQNDRAIAHLQRAVQFGDPKKSGVDIANALIALSNLEPPEKQLEDATKAVAIAQTLEKALVPGSIENELNVGALTQLSQLQMDQKKNDDALKSLRQLADVAKGAEKWDRAAWACLAMAKLFQETGKGDLSKKALEEGLPYAEKGTDKEQLDAIKKYMKK